MSILRGREDVARSAERFDLIGHGHALPGDEPQWPRDRVADIVHTRLEVVLDLDSRRINGTATHHIVPLNDGLDEIPFDAVDMDVDGVTVDGRPADYDYDREVLSVRLEPAGRRGSERKVVITYRAAPRLGLYFVGPDSAYPDKPAQVWTQGQDDDSRHWFPCCDVPNSKHTSELLVTVPGDWRALSNGRLLEEKRLRNGTRRFHWYQERPHSTYLVTLVAGQFACVDDSRDGLAIDYYVEQKDVDRARLTFGRTPEMVALFEEVTGTRYPWAKYSQVVVRDFIFGGMENTSATTLTEAVLLDERAAIDFTADDLVSHELAHMWFGDLLTCRDWSHGWLNEGFATYLELLWTERHLGIDEYRQAVLQNAEAYFGERYRRPIVSNVFHAPIDIFDRHLYEKGSLVLHMLRHVLGDDAFFRSLQRYVHEHQERNVVTQDLVDAIAAETGRNLEWFFDQWVYRPGHPSFKVRWTWSSDDRVATVVVEQTQDPTGGVPDAFRVPVSIGFQFSRGRPRSFRVEIHERRQSFAFALPSKPALCRFDPGYTAVRELDFDKPSRELLFQLRTDDDVTGRAWAAGMLGKRGGMGVVEALETAVMHDRFWGVQAAAGKALGQLRSAEARDALVRCLKVRHPKARRAVVAALGEFRGDREAFDALRRPAAGDTSYFVEAEALRSLGKSRLPEALDLLAGAIDRPSFRDVIRMGCIDGLVELGDERGIELIARAAEYGQPWFGRRLAVPALAKIGEQLPDEVPQLVRRVVRFLRDPDVRVRIAAAHALRDLAEPSSVAELEAMASREVDGRALRAAREAAVVIRKSESERRAVRSVRDDLERLRDENARVRSRVEKLEQMLKVSEN